MTARTTSSSMLDSCYNPESSSVACRKQQRRRPSHNSRQSIDAEDDDSAIALKVDLFLNELEQRLDALEDYGSLTLDEGILRAWNTLHAVREECTRVKEEVLGEGRRRARVLVDILESRYNEAVAAKETLPGKVQAGVHFLEELLGDFETRAAASLDRKIGRAKRGMSMVVETKDFLAESIERAIKAARERRLITYEELPVPWRTNPFITRGYRFTETKLECVRSAMFELSNETANIWTHGVGFIIILAIAFYFYPNSQLWTYHTSADKVVNAIFFLAAAKALACSTIWHTFSSISHQQEMERFACVDYSGISLLIAASIITTEYCAFYVDPISQWLYITITLIFGIAGVVLPWRPVFNRADMRGYRVFFYVSLGATGAIPMIQLTYTRGLWWTMMFYLPILKSIIVYLCGATIYALQVPEKYYPGCFDWVGGSHNWWHICVLGGILFHWYAMHDLFQKAFLMAMEA